MASKSELQSLKARFGIVGNSPLLEAALDTAARAASTNLSVLILGESGVGKESFSKIIHTLSPRKHNQFIAVNCGAIPAGTINSELFGHEKGSFTSSVGERKGYFETVDKGTIFLDEIGEMPLDTQAYLLRILENGEFLRLGSSKVLKTDVRVVAATNVNLEERVRKGRFREDLYYRLNQVPIRVPSLKERRDDIYLLFVRFAIDFGERNRRVALQLDDDAKMVLENYPWPGNIRELKNAVEQLSVLTDMSILNAPELLRILPNLSKRNLPAHADAFESNGEKGDFSEREILYKLLFDMKSDLNDLKSLVFELIRSNNLNVSAPALQQLQYSNISTSSPIIHEEAPRPHYKIEEIQPIQMPHVAESNRPIIIDAQNTSQHEVVDESMSLDEMEKLMIVRSLKKHGGRRKEAARDLGFSERTLYRKIKMYDLDK